MANQIDITREASDLVVTVPWRAGSAGGGLILSGAGMFLFVVITVLALSGDGDIAFMLFVAGPLLYFGLATFLNKTTLRISTRRILLERGPLPTFRKRQEEQSSSSIDQLYLKRAEMKQTSGKGSNKKVTHFYHLAAKLNNGDEWLLLRNYADRNLILEVERVIEDHLGIEDRAVAIESAPLSQQNMEMLERVMPTGMTKVVKESFAAEQARLHRERNEGKPGYQPHPASSEDFRYDNAPSASPTSDGGSADDDYIPTPRTRDRAPDPTSATGPAAGDLRKSLRGIFDGDDRPHPDLPPADEPNELAVRTTGGTGTFRDRPVRLANDDIAKYANGDVGRRISLTYVEGDEPPTQVYAHYNKGEWTYGEERALDAGELTALGFDTTAEAAPLSLRNGDDRYYPGEEFSGKLTDGRPVRQYTYVTTRDSTRFRAVKVGHGDWRVFVHEPV